MTTYTVLPQDDLNLEITVTDPALTPSLQADSDLDVVIQEAENPVVLNITPAAVSITSAVTSVNDLVGDVTLTTTEISEGDNLYYTEARFDTRLATKDTDDLTEGSNLYYTESRATANFDSNLSAADTDDLSEGDNNLYYTTARANTDFDTRLATKDTDDLTEGDNLYYTDARADARVNLQTGANLDLSSKSTTDLAEGDNLYYTQARFDTALAAKTTTNLTEGSNLYYTDARVQSVIDTNTAQFITADSTDTLTNKSGLISQWTNDAGYLTEETDSQTLSFTSPDLTISNGNTVDISAINNITSVNGLTGVVVLDTDDIDEGTANLYYTAERVDDQVNTLLTAGNGVDLEYNDDAGTLTITSEVSEFTAKNRAGETITKGTPVYISGHSGNTTEIGIADADDASKMPAFGIAEADIADNNNGTILTYGVLRGFDTSDFSVGDELFVSNTGTLTNTRPSTESDLVQKIAKVVRSHAQNGILFVMGAGRSNDIPNLASGHVFIGDGSGYEARALTTTDVSEGTNKYLTTANIEALDYDSDGGTY